MHATYTRGNVDPVYHRACRNPTCELSIQAGPESQTLVYAGSKVRKPYQLAVGDGLAGGEV
jgi:hypothetical protein